MRAIVRNTYGSPILSSARRSTSPTPRTARSWYESARLPWTHRTLAALRLSHSCWRGQDGSWLIVGGTGAYANEKGEGDFHKIINVWLGQVTITLTGTVQ